MSVRLAVAVCMGTALIVSGQPAAGQTADVHARAIARASCLSGKHSDATTDAKAAMERAPDDIGPRMRLADALVDQGCYQEAVEILEAAQETFPRNAELSGKLRDIRSLVTEQTYIEGLTQAAESAKLTRNQLRCTKLSDIVACEDALRSKPDDTLLLVAKGDALMQAGRPVDAVTAYRHVAQLKPGDDAVKNKLANAEALVARTQPSLAGAPDATSAAAVAANTATPRPKAPRKAPAHAATNGDQHVTATPTTAYAASTPPETKTYSNDAQPGQTN